VKFDSGKQAELCDTFYLAPLRGVTVRVFRQALAECFAVPDLAVAPFIPIVAGSRVKPGLLRDIDKSAVQSVPLIPQLIGKDADQLRVMLREFKSSGYLRADLNVGCPWPFVIKKGRGCGLLRDVDNLARLLEVGCTEMENGFSIKVRLGISEPNLLLRNMELINSFPLCEVTVHARTARQMYNGEVRLDVFEEVARLCRHPVVYNGDMRSVDDFLLLKQRFPQIKRWMIGRGISIDPFLMESIKAGVQVGRDSERLCDFLERTLRYSINEMGGERQVLGRLKELWSYLHTGMADGVRLWNSIKICRTVTEYRGVVNAAFERGIVFKTRIASCLPSCSFETKLQSE
jgi:tRNA-dihydrouridine synthase B